jgi:ATP-dependent Clp protease ATP-binding subunit ClpA
MKDEALKLALDALEEAWYHVGTFQPTEKAIDLYDEARTAIKAALAQPAQEPTAVDATTMELAESVGLIGPASRTHDLHAAIQRFHDLICANATLKAAKMAADAISEVAPPQPVQREWIGLTDEEQMALLKNSDGKTRHWLVWEVEAKLKEKNSG